MRFIALVLAVVVLAGTGSSVVIAADMKADTQKANAHRAHNARHARVKALPRFVCNEYGRCWSSRFLNQEDYASGRLFLVNHVNRRAGVCVGYNYQYPVGWDECAGDWNYGRGRISH